MITRNGIHVSIDNWSHFVPGHYAVMHLSREGGYQSGDTPYPEVSAVKCITPVEHYHIPTPQNVRYEVAKREDGKILVRVYSQGREEPVLEWVFPSQNEAHEKLYPAFVNGL
tara:strand:+ start:45116 stop:45451 length:336 start_codon:yes stop_codon:yes gene_type:complete